MNALSNINTISGQEENTMQKVNRVEDNGNEDRISISISRKAYDALVEYTKQLNQEKPNTQKPFTIEEVLDEEIILLFSDEWNKE